MKTQIRGALARGYCSPENEKKVVDPVLIEAMVGEIIELLVGNKHLRERLHISPDELDTR